MRLNQTSEWNVMTICISRELPLLNFERLDILCAWIKPLSEKLWQFEFLDSFHRGSGYIMRLNRTSEWKVMTIWISRELPLLNFERLDILCAWIGPLSEKLWQFEFLESFHCSILGVSIYYAPESDLRLKSNDHLNFPRASIAQFRGSGYIMHLNWTSERNVLTIWISRELPLFNFERLYMWYAWIGPPS